jgi:quercetin dioxygenase-like cupin family protein
MAYKNKIIKNEVTGQEIRFLETTQDTGGQYLEMESTFRSKSVEPPPHYHPNQKEEFFIKVGELTVRLNGQVKVVKAGEIFHIPPNTVHSMWNAGEAEAVVNWKVIPAMKTEYFLETVNGLVMDNKFKRGKPPLLQLAILGNKFFQEYRMHKPSALVQRIIFTLLSPIGFLLGYRGTYKQYIN